VRVVGALALLLALGASPALGQTRRAAVIILGTRAATQTLADNLTEVAMARVAGRRFEVVGTEEFRGRLGMLRDPQACLQDAACLGRVAVELVVTKIVVGTLALERHQYLFHLALWDLPSGALENRVFRLVEGPVEDLVRNVQDAVDALFLPRPEPSRIHIDSEPRGARVFLDNVFLGVTPMLSPEVLAGRHLVAVDHEHHFPWTSTVEVPPGERLDVRLTAQSLPPAAPARRRRPVERRRRPARPRDRGAAAASRRRSSWPTPPPRTQCSTSCAASAWAGSRRDC
jgi:hypothetical protein